MIPEDESLRADRGALGPSSTSSIMRRSLRSTEVGEERAGSQRATKLDSPPPPLGGGVRKAPAPAGPLPEEG